MDELQLLIDLHKDANRQGPGGEEELRKALDLAMIDGSRPLKVVDIGCGTGASALWLANQLKCQITAVDLHQEFLDELNSRARSTGLSQSIVTECCSMGDLPFPECEFDLIWSEGAIYNIGFAKGITDWKRHLKSGGVLVVSEITWLTRDRPMELQNYWSTAYSEIDLASAKLETLEKAGYSPIGYFALPEKCWLENYYRPLQNRFQEFLDRNGHSDLARSIVDAEQQEILMYEQYKEFYSYGVYIARKTD